jgi:hypothetical protein
MNLFNLQITIKNPEVRNFYDIVTLHLLLEMWFELYE